MIQKIQLYEEQIQRVRERFNPSYYSTEQLEAMNKKAEEELNRMISKGEKDDTKLKARQAALENRFKVHPDREVVKVWPVVEQTTQNMPREKIEKIIGKNCLLNISIELKKLHIILDKEGQNRKILRGKDFTFSLHYLDKQTSLPPLRIHNDHLQQKCFPVHKVPNILHLHHLVQEENYHLMMHLLHKEQIHLVCQSSGRLVCGWASLSLGELICEGELFTEKERNIIFYTQNLEQEQQVAHFGVVGKVKVELKILAPKISTLANRMKAMSPHKEKKVISVERSSSPQNRKKLLQTLLNPPCSTHKLTMLDGYPMNLTLSHSIPVYYEAEAIIEQMQNIGQKMIQIQNKKLQLYFRLKKADKAGEVRFRVGEQLYEIQVEMNGLFREVNGVRERENCVMKLGCGFRVRGGAMVKFYPNQIQQTALRQCLSALFVKMQVGEFEFEMPLGMDFHVRRVDTGYMIHYILPDITSPIDKLTLPVSLRHSSPTSAFHNMVEIHYFCVKVKRPKPSITHYLYAGKAGFYELETESLLRKGTNYRLRCLGCSLNIVTHTLHEGYVLDYVMVELMEEVEGERQGLLMIDDMDKRVTTCVKLIISNLK